MGSSISGILAILAILFVDRLETIALSSHLSISPYKRYVIRDMLTISISRKLAKKWQTNATRFQSHHLQKWQKLLRVQEATVRTPPISYTQEIKAQLHSQ